MKYLLVISLLLTSLSAEVKLSPKQLKVKNLILKIAPKHTKYKSTILAIAMIESSLGLMILGDDSKSLGILQLQVPTIRYIISKDKDLAFLSKYKDKQLATFVLRNDDLSIIIASKLFEYYRKRYGYFQAISRYNGGTKNVTYYNKVMSWKKKFTN